MTNWKPFSELPEEYKSSRKRFLVRASINKFVNEYITDEYVVWYDPASPTLVCSRWSWDVEPTHFCLIPE